jgi:hypothetical protein
MAKPVKILVLGNDPQINEIDFSRLGSDIVTIGVNRIWLKHIPNYFFFNDREILKELEKFPDAVKALSSKSRCYSSDWLLFPKSQTLTVPNWLTVYDRPKKTSFPDSITTAISLFRTRYLKGADATFYIAGVSLIWSNPSHFWKEIEYDSLNRHGEDWYARRFNLILQNFKSLSIPRNKIISVHPNSLLNKHYRYEGIENLYTK